MACVLNSFTCFSSTKLLPDPRGKIPDKRSHKWPDKRPDKGLTKA